MIPVSDQNPTRTTPFVTYVLIALNIVAFLMERQLIGSHGESYVVAGYGLVPSRISADPLGEAFTVFTSMFMHGGWAHLGSNMLFLHIFGDNLEDVMGHRRYAAFYLLSGVAAALAQILIDTASPVPMV